MDPKEKLATELENFTRQLSKENFIVLSQGFGLGSLEFPPAHVDETLDLQLQATVQPSSSSEALKNLTRINPAHKTSTPHPLSPEMAKVVSKGWKVKAQAFLRTCFRFILQHIIDLVFVISSLVFVVVGFSGYHAFKNQELSEWLTSILGLAPWLQQFSLLEFFLGTYLLYLGYWLLFRFIASESLGRYIVRKFFTSSEKSSRGMT